MEKLAQNLAKARDMLYLGSGQALRSRWKAPLNSRKFLTFMRRAMPPANSAWPIALIDDTMPVIVIAPFDRVFEKTVSNMQEVAARGGKTILVTDPQGPYETTLNSLETLSLPDMASTVTPLVCAIPVQLIAYHCTQAIGTDINQPRNLTKSVRWNKLAP